MIIGVPKEIKVREYRVGMTPSGVAQMVANGHKVNVEKCAGEGAGFSDEEYVKAGASILDTADEVWGSVNMVIKVKEPIEPEYKRFRDDLLLFTYLHLAAEPTLTSELEKSGIASIAYETIEDRKGGLPLLKPMSEIAGRMSVQAGAVCLEKEHGGRGVLLGGVPGVKRGNVVILGGGIVGSNAAKIAVGMGAHVTIFDVNVDRMEYLEHIFDGRLHTRFSNPADIAEAVKDADMVVGGVLITGAKAPKLVTEQMVTTMNPGSVIVDVSVDQGGCVETTHATTHDDPTFIKHNVIHYGVANMPGAVTRTSTMALTNVTLGYALRLANMGFAAAIKADNGLALGVNTYKGHCTYEAVARDCNTGYKPLVELL